jgi:hypothetical protein
MTALYKNISGGYNISLGTGSLRENTTGDANIAIGYASMLNNISGDHNIGVGYWTLYGNTTGFQNTAIGSLAARNNTSGSNNTAIGFYSMYYNTMGYGNTAIGSVSLLSNISGSRNTALGDSAGYGSLGNGNLFLGYKAGQLETSGNNKLYIANNFNSTLIYGDFATHQVLMGEANATGYVFKGTRTLNVKGGLLADSVRVALSTTWSDFVFHKNYRLIPLPELEKFISQKGHLPDIPTAAEVKAEGIELGDMNARLLQKIEELTLYILQQEKRIQALERAQQKKSFEK